MSNLRSDCRDLLKSHPPESMWKAHVEALIHQIDLIEEWWHVAEQKVYLLERGWEHTMTEAEGCDTWHYPYHLRKFWPEHVQKSNGTQVYWDRDDALELERSIEER